MEIFGWQLEETVGLSQLAVGGDSWIVVTVVWKLEEIVEKW